MLCLVGEPPTDHDIIHTKSVVDRMLQPLGLIICGYIILFQELVSYKPSAHTMHVGLRFINNQTTALSARNNTPMNIAGCACPVHEIGWQPPAVTAQCSTAALSPLTASDAILS